MHTIIAAVVVLTLFVSLLLWLLRFTANGRAAQLASAGDQLKLSYEPWRALSHHIKQAGFQVMSTGEARYVQHWLENDSLAMFDFISMNGHGPSPQTLIIVPCPLTLAVRFTASQKPWIQADCFTEQPKQSLVKIPAVDLPDALHAWHIAGIPAHKIRALFNKTVIHWLLTHPHLHIEWSTGMLLVCQPGYLIEASEIEAVIADVEQLKQALIGECAS